MGATPELKSDEVVDELADALAGKTGDETVVEDEPEPEPVKETPKEEKGEEKAEDKPAEKTEEKDTLFDTDEQNRELRQLLRSQKRDMAILKAKLERVEKRSVEASKKVEKELDDDETLFGEKKAPEKAAEPADDFSPVELLQTELAQISKVKGPVLETLLEVMEASPKFADIRDVCSQANFDDIFEAIGDAVAAKEGKDASLAALEAEAAVWKMPNPYKYMYGLIKQYHPKYVARQQGTKEAPVTKPKEPAKAPSSIADKAGKSAPSNAWTSARIDELDEMELNKVPADIYEKYLRGELD